MAPGNTIKLTTESHGSPQELILILSVVWVFLLCPVHLFISLVGNQAKIWTCCIFSIFTYYKK